MFKQILKNNFEWAALLLGLLLMGTMNPYIDNGISFCLFELAGFQFCPGEGLGHSIAFTFRGDFQDALQAHPVGPAAVLILAGRIGFLWKEKFKSSLNNKKVRNYGKDD